MTSTSRSAVRPRPWQRSGPQPPPPSPPGVLRRVLTPAAAPAPFIAPYLHLKAPIARESQWQRRALSGPAAGVGRQLAGRGLRPGTRGSSRALRATPALWGTGGGDDPESCGSGCACFPSYPEQGAQVCGAC